MEQFFDKVYTGLTTDTHGNLLERYENPEGEWSLVITFVENEDVSCVVINAKPWVPDARSDDI